MVEEERERGGREGGGVGGVVVRGGGGGGGGGGMYSRVSRGEGSLPYGDVVMLVVDIPGWRNCTLLTSWCFLKGLGMVWYGMLRYCMEWTWYGMVWYVILWYTHLIQ